MYLSKLRTYITLPTLSIANTWRGASEIVHRCVYTFGFNPSFVDIFPLTPASTTNCCVCVAWKPTAETIVRYKLWKDVGEILYVPLYSGQRITGYDGTFSIEVWNTNTATSNIGGEVLYTSKLVFPLDHCDEDAIDLNLPCVECVIPVFDLTDFNPLNGDYFTIVGCITSSFNGVTLFDIDGYLVKATDTTWHTLELIRFNGVTSLSSSPAATPPVGTKEYLPLIDMISGIEFEVRLQHIVTDLITTYHLYIGASAVDVDKLNVLYLRADDVKYYGIRLRMGWNYLLTEVEDENSQFIVDQFETIP